MLRIAISHLRHAESGGTERYLDLLAAHLAERGHEVTIVCRSHARAPHPKVRFVVLRPFSIGAAWRLWSFARAVEALVEREQFDVVYGLGRTWSQDLLRLGGGSQQTYLELAHASTRTRIERSLGLGRLKQRTILAIERRALSPGAAWRVVVNARQVKQDIIARFSLAPELIEVIYNGVDIERFHPRLRANEGKALRSAWNFTDEHILILFLGSGYGRKGLASVIDAFPAVLRARPNARLVVVGFDSAQRDYEARSRRLGIASSVRFLGGRTDAPACFAACDLYVLPTHYDPFANSTLEALALGLPVITSDANGGSELLHEGIEGSILPAGCEPIELERAMIAWCDSERLRVGAHAARALAEAHSHHHAMDQSAELIERCAEQRSAR